MVYADHVKCNNCDSTMKVVVGTEVCPVCKAKGCLSWVNEEHQEVIVYSENEILNFSDRENVIKGTEKGNIILIPTLVGKL